MTQNKKEPKEIIGIILLIMSLAGMVFNFGMALVCMYHSRHGNALLSLFNISGWVMLSKFSISHFNLSKYDTDK